MQRLPLFLERVFGNLIIGHNGITKSRFYGNSMGQIHG